MQIIFAISIRYMIHTAIAKVLLVFFNETILCIFFYISIVSYIHQILYFILMVSNVCVNIRTCLDLID